MLGVLAPVTAAEPVGLPFQWSQSFLTAPDGTRLHADILRPEGISADTLWGHSDCDSKCGATDFDTELLAFFDKHVADRDIEVPGPRITVGQFDGGWRSETAWPPADSRRVPIDLRTGTYTDRGLLPGPDREIWSISQPLSTTAHISGIPMATLRLSGPPTATVAVELFDIAPDGRGTIITRGIAPVADTADIQLLAQDWPISRGTSRRPDHRCGRRCLVPCRRQCAGHRARGPVGPTPAQHPADSGPHRWHQRGLGEVA